MLRFALRRAFRHVRFSVAVVLSLATTLGIAAAVFALEDAVDLRDPLFPNPERLVSVQIYRPPSGFCGGCRTPSPEPLTRSILRSASFAQATSYNALGLAVRDEIGAEYVRGIEVKADFFRLLGVQPLLGRVLQASDFGTDAEPALVASHEFWRTALGGDLDVVGRRIALIADRDGGARSFVVVGVMPRRFSVPANSSVWVTPFSQSDRSWILARLKPRISRERTALELSGVLRSALADDAELRGATVQVLPFREDQIDWLGLSDRRFLLVGIATLALILAATNIVTLYLSRLSAAAGEFATRASLGATTTRLIAELISEVAVLGIFAGLIALGVASWCIRLLSNRLGMVGVPLRLDARVVVFEMGLALILSLAIGAAVGLSMRRADLMSRLRVGIPAGRQSERRAQLGAIILQLAGAVLFTSAALQSVQQLTRAVRVPLGYDPVGLISITFPTDNRSNAFGAPDAVDTVVRQVENDLERFSSIAGIASAAVEARPAVEPVQVADATGDGVQSWHEIRRVASITDEYFNTIGIGVVLGRAFGADDRSGSTAVAVISRSLSERLWPRSSPIGRQLHLRGDGSEIDVRTVVGMVADIGDGRAGGSSAVPSLYLPYAQSPTPRRTYWLRGKGEARAILPNILSTVAELRPTLAKTQFPAIEVVSEQLDRETAGPRLNALILSALAVSTVALAALGIVGIVSHLVRIRRREIGIRLALGASRSQVVHAIASGTLLGGALGVLLGIVGSFAAAGILRASISGLETPTTPLILTSGLMAALVALLATAVPAYVGGTVGAAELLREE